MSEVVNFPTPRERAGVSMQEDMDMLLDALMGSLVAIKNSENIADDEREADMQPIMDLFLKYIELSGERYPIEDLEE